MELQNLTSTNIANLSKPLWDNLITASNQQDFELFAKDFSAKMLQGATKKNIQQQWREQPLLTCLSAGPEYLGVLKNARGVRVLWKQKSADTPDELLGHLELIVENGQVKIDGAQIF